MQKCNHATKVAPRRKFSHQVEIFKLEGNQSKVNTNKTAPSTGLINHYTEKINRALRVRRLMKLLGRMQLK